eukprot:m.476001 g.476001  ORF g.476001 m.476001 type:complete len:239 (-) comp20399_c0_seq42:885-1601(-)
MNKDAVKVVVLRQHVLRLCVHDSYFVTVFFNAGAGSSGRSPLHACTSFDVAVAARDTPQLTAMKGALQALHIVTSELAGVCAKDFSQLKLEVWAFAKSTEEEQHLPQLHPLKAFGDDRVRFSELLVKPVVDDADEDKANDYCNTGSNNVSERSVQCRLLCSRGARLSLNSTKPNGLFRCSLPSPPTRFGPDKRWLNQTAASHPSDLAFRRHLSHNKSPPTRTPNCSRRHAQTPCTMMP